MSGNKRGNIFYWNKHAWECSTACPFKKSSLNQLGIGIFITHTCSMDHSSLWISDFETYSLSIETSYRWPNSTRGIYNMLCMQLFYVGYLKDNILIFVKALPRSVPLQTISIAHSTIYFREIKASSNRCMLKGCRILLLRLSGKKK